VCGENCKQLKQEKTMSEAIIHTEMSSPSGYRYLLSNNFFSPGETVTDGKLTYHIQDVPSTQFCDDSINQCGYVYSFEEKIENPIGKRLTRTSNN